MQIGDINNTKGAITVITDDWRHTALGKLPVIKKYVVPLIEFALFYCESRSGLINNKYMKL